MKKIKQIPERDRQNYELPKRNKKSGAKHRFFLLYQFLEGEGGTNYTNRCSTVKRIATLVEYKEYTRSDADIL